MKKLLIMSLLFTALALKSIQPACTPCTQAAAFPDRFHFVKTYTHGAPVQSVSTNCDCNGVNYVAVAGYSTFDCIYPASIRAYTVNLAMGNHLDDIQVIPANPSDYLYSVEMCCINEVPHFVVAGCPDSNGNVVWMYALDTTVTPNVFRQVAGWGSNENPLPTLQYSAAFKCVPTADGIYQIASVGQQIDNFTARVYILAYDPIAESLVTQSFFDIENVDPDNSINLFKAAWYTPNMSPSNCGCMEPCALLVSVVTKMINACGVVPREQKMSI